MRAVVLRAPGEVAVEERPEPRLVDAGDAIVRVTVAGLCGSDLHIVTGRDRGCRAGTIMGHELCGVIDSVGPAVTAFRAGDRVVAPFTVSCGGCFYCARGLTGRCARSVGFGFVDEAGRGLQGAQAERVRVPLADTTLVRVPARTDGTPLTDREALFAGDIMSTAYGCAAAAGIAPGDTVAVVGCGPVGLLAVQAARLFAPGAVVAIDGVPERRDRARAWDALAVAPADAPAAIASLTDGRGADAVLEAVGATPALDLAFALLRPGGTISVAGYHTSEVYPLPIQAAYGKNLTLRVGRCHARALMDVVLPLVIEDRLRPTAVITHELPMNAAAEAYDMFAARRDGAIKVLFDPAR